MKIVVLTLLMSLFVLLSPALSLNIYVDGIIEKNTLMPCIYINNHLVMKIPNKGVKGYYPSHFERAQSIAKRLKQLEKQGVPLQRIYIRYTEKAYSAFIKGTRLYTISKKDEDYFKKSAYSIAKMWRNNIKHALINKSNQISLKTQYTKKPSWFDYINEKSLWFKSFIASLLIITFLLTVFTLSLYKLSTKKMRAIECKLAFLEKKIIAKK